MNGPSVVSILPSCTRTVVAVWGLQLEAGAHARGLVDRPVRLVDRLLLPLRKTLPLAGGVTGARRLDGSAARTSCPFLLERDCRFYDERTRRRGTNLVGSLIALYRKAADRRADGRRFAGTAPMRFRCNGSGCTTRFSDPAAGKAARGAVLTNPSQRSIPGDGKAPNMGERPLSSVGRAPPW